MNDRFFANIVKMAVSCVLFYTGFFHVLIRLTVRRGLLIFNYHGFNTFTNDYWRFGSLFESGYGLNFERQVRFFERCFRRHPDPGRLEASGVRPAYVLTFDDGYKDNFEIALPVLMAHSVSSVFFVTTGAIGTDEMLWYDSIRFGYEREQPRGFLKACRVKGKSKEALRSAKEGGPGANRMGKQDILRTKTPRLMMNWDEVRIASEAGVLIGAHTHTHPVLSQLSREAQIEEIRTSLGIIDAETKRTPALFSYPEGKATSFNAETVGILRNLGIQFALTTETGINDPSSSPYALKRIGVNPSDPVPVVAMKIAVLGLKSKLGWRRFAARRDRIVLAVRQYGWWNAVKRAVKAVLRMLGIRIEANYMLRRNLDDPLDISPPIHGLSVKPLAYPDFEASPFFAVFPPEKRALLIERFSDPAYRAFGAEIGGKLVYMAWIATDHLRIEHIGFERKMDPGEGVLLDAMTIPGSRGLGIHNYMNTFRLLKLREMGIRRAYVAVLAENRPALKTQIKSGFREGEKLLWVGIGRAGHLRKTPVRFSATGGETRG